MVTFLAQEYKMDVYRVDLAAVVNKYIGETEKNISKLLSKSEYRDCILFFDEADALFGKRTGIADSHDRYANQDIGYLLDRMENHEGIVILSTNSKANVPADILEKIEFTIKIYPEKKSKTEEEEEED